MLTRKADDYLEAIFSITEEKWYANPNSKIHNPYPQNEWLQVFNHANFVAFAFDSDIYKANHNWNFNVPITKNKKATL